MMRGAACGAALMSCAMLQGCGDSSDTTTPQPTTPVVTTTPNATVNVTTAQPTTTAAPNTTTTVTTTKAPTIDDLVAELNARYVAWDPDDATSPLGLLYSIGSPLGSRCNGCDGGSSADCKLTATLLNNRISVPGKDMLYRQGTQGGFLYWPESVAPLVRCSYAQDGATAGRINHGCGCEAATACHGDMECPSACENKDPSTGNEYLKNSSMFSRCHCRPGESANEHCYWEGPAFYHDEGYDEMRGMVQQRHMGMNAVQSQWNEVVVDSQLHEQALQEDAAGLIAAFIIPVNSRCESGCIRQLLDIRDETTDRLKLADPIPVVALNVDGGDNIFEVFDPFRPAPSPDHGPAPGPSPDPAPAPAPAPVASGSCCWGGDTCDVATNCHFDAYCGQSEDACTGSCAGVWCEQALV